MRNDNHGFIVRRKWQKLISSMSRERAGGLLVAIMDRIFDGIVYDGDDEVIKTAYLIMVDEMLGDLENYKAKCARNRASAQRRWRKQIGQHEKTDSDIEISAYDDPDAI